MHFEKRHTLITGGTGFIGNAVTSALLNRGEKVTVQSRTPNKFAHLETQQMQFIQHIDQLDSAPTHFINLAGAGIADKRWSKQRKQVLVESRIKPINELTLWLNKHDIKLTASICSSAIGFYGFNSNNNAPFTEHSIPEHTTHFSQQLCQQVEDTAKQLLPHTHRLNLIRTGVVIGSTINNRGGALQKMRLPAQFCLNGRIGSGEQMISWIHMSDLVNAVLHLLDNNESKGTYNLTSPSPCTNLQLSEAIAKSIDRHFQLPVPAFMLKLMMGEASDLLTKGQSVLPQKLLEEGFEFKFSNIKKAVYNCI